MRVLLFLSCVNKNLAFTFLLKNSCFVLKIKENEKKKSVKSVKKSMLFVEIMWKFPCVKSTDLHFRPYAYIFFHHSSLSTTCHGFLFLSISNPITDSMLWFIKEHASELSLRLEVVPEYKIVCNAETRAERNLRI